MAKKGNLAGTMIGMASPLAQGGQHLAEPPHNAPSPPAKPHLAGTMIGMPVPAIPSSPGDGNSPTPSTPGTSALGRTMVGLGGSGTPTAINSASPPAGAEQAAAQRLAAGSPGSSEADMGRFKGTLLGVAQPGIAPSHDGPMAPATPPPHPQVDATPGTQNFIPTIPTPAVPSGVGAFPITERKFPWKNVGLVVAGLVIAAGLGGLVALLNKNPYSIVVKEFAVDEKGRDRLKLMCPECPDGSTLMLGRAVAEVQDEQAVLLPDAPLSLGQNTLDFALAGPDGELLAVRPLKLPVAFRVSTDTEEGRLASPAYGRVVVQAPDGSHVTIGDSDVPLKHNQAVRHVQLNAQTMGESRNTQSFSLPFPIKVKIGSTEKKTQATLKGVVTPLSLSSIGPMHELGGKDVTILGTTTPGATVTAGEQRTTAGEDGKFRLILPQPEPTTLQLQAATEHLVGRTVTITLTPSSPIPKDAMTSFSELASGGIADIRGNVLESWTKDGVTLALVDVAKGCESPPCVVRLIYAEPHRLAPNRPVRALGVAEPGDPITLKVQKFH